MSRIRIKFSKQGALRYSGHLDLHKLWERAARRANLPLACSQGFHPQPKISIAAALPLGYSSRCEVVDLRLNDELALDEIAARLKGNLPAGIQVCEIERVDERAPALQTQLRAAEYEVEITEAVSGSALKRKVGELMRAESLPRQRRAKSYDLRPLVEELRFSESDNACRIFMRLAARQGATGRPEEVLTALDLAPEFARIERTRLIFEERR